MRYFAIVLLLAGLVGCGSPSFTCDCWKERATNLVHGDPTRADRESFKTWCETACPKYYHERGE